MIISFCANDVPRFFVINAHLVVKVGGSGLGGVLNETWRISTLFEMFDGEVESFVFQIYAAFEHADRSGVLQSQRKY